jgi:hypothetical protein
MNNIIEERSDSFFADPDPAGFDDYQDNFKLN